GRLHSDLGLTFTVAGTEDTRKAFNRKERKGFAKKTTRGCEMKMWSGRFRQPLDPTFESWQRSFEFDCRLLECELDASAAHARALMNAVVLSEDELHSVLQGLEQIGEKAAASPEFLNDLEAEDVHHFVEKQLVTLIGDTGYKLHSGR